MLSASEEPVPTTRSTSKLHNHLKPRTNCHPGAQRRICCRDTLQIQIAQLPHAALNLSSWSEAKDLLPRCAHRGKT